MNLPRPDEWVFFRDCAGRWRWQQRRRGMLMQEAFQGFDTRDECLSDAERNGFLAGPASSPPESGPFRAPNMSARRDP